MISIENFIKDNYQREEIRIIDGHNSSSYFWIMPVKITDFSDTDDMDNVNELRNLEISIEEDDVDQYLTPFLYKHFDKELEANKNRAEWTWEDENGDLRRTYYTDFEWYLTYNFYSFESIKNIINDIQNTINALTEGIENEFTAQLREKRGFAAGNPLYAKDWTAEQIEEYNNNRPTQDYTRPKVLIEFYSHFITKLEHMMEVGKEEGYDLISFMGP